MSWTGHEGEPARGKNRLEWAVFAVSLVIVVGVLALLVRAAVLWPGGPPRLSVELGQATSDGDAWVVPVRLVNQGGSSAEHIVVEVTSGAETVELELERIPRGGSVRGWVGFTAPPRPGETKARVRGFQAP
jgi:uncharacterized protein (TIGR02588 family)